MVGIDDETISAGANAFNAEKDDADSLYSEKVKKKIKKLCMTTLYKSISTQ